MLCLPLFSLDSLRSNLQLHESSSATASSHITSHFDIFCSSNCCSRVAHGGGCPPCQRGVRPPRVHDDARICIAPSGSTRDRSPCGIIKLYGRRSNEARTRGREKGAQAQACTYHEGDWHQSGSPIAPPYSVSYIADLLGYSCTYIADAVNCPLMMMSSGGAAGHGGLWGL